MNQKSPLLTDDITSTVQNFDKNRKGGDNFRGLERDLLSAKHRLTQTLLTSLSVSSTVTFSMSTNPHSKAVKVFPPFLFSALGG
jgi:hypothetical protein